jgi:hypothetical protein
MVKCRHTECNNNASQGSAYCKYCVQLPAEKCNFCNKVEQQSRVPRFIGKVLVRGLVSFVVSSLLTFTYLFAIWVLNFAFKLGWVLPASEDILVTNGHVFIWMFGIWMFLNIVKADPFGIEEMMD